MYLIAHDEFAASFDLKPLMTCPKAVYGVDQVTWKAGASILPFLD
jgi:hypothetical protein